MSDREYQPLYAEKRCAHCNGYRGQHLYTGDLDADLAALSVDANMACVGLPTCFVPYISPADIAARREWHIRDCCVRALQHDQEVKIAAGDTSGGLTNRQWLAQTILNILDGKIDHQIRREVTGDR